LVAAGSRLDQTVRTNLLYSYTSNWLSTFSVETPPTVQNSEKLAQERAKVAANKALLAKAAASRKRKTTDPLNLEELFESGPSSSASSSPQLSSANIAALIARIADLEKGAKARAVPEQKQFNPAPIAYDPLEPELYGNPNPYKTPKLNLKQQINKIINDLNGDIIKNNRRAVERLNNLKIY